MYNPIPRTHTTPNHHPQTQVQSGGFPSFSMPVSLHLPHPPVLSSPSILHICPVLRCSILAFLRFVEEELQASTEQSAGATEAEVESWHESFEELVTPFEDFPLLRKIRAWAREAHATLEMAELLSCFQAIARYLYQLFWLECVGHPGEKVIYHHTEHQILLSEDDLSCGEMCILWSVGFRIVDGPVLIQPRVISLSV